jgi:hypothetical protein
MSIALVVSLYIASIFVVGFSFYALMEFFAPTNDIPDPAFVLLPVFWPIVLPILAIIVGTAVICEQGGKFIKKKAKAYHERKRLKTIVSPDLVKKFKV